MEEYIRVGGSGHKTYKLPHGFRL